LLVGVGRAALRGEVIPSSVVDYQRSVQDRVPRLEQLARIARLIDWKTAEKAGNERLLGELLESASTLLGSDLDKCQLRMGLAEAWGTASPARRREAAVGYAVLIGRARTESQLLAVIHSLHRFFRGEGTPDRSRLRTAAYEALQRVYDKQSPAASVQKSLSDQFEDLHLLGTSSRPTPRAIRRLLGS
jgi:hypothetical protein